MTGNRGTGRTTMQMLTAPHGAIFVWCGSMLDYPITLSCRLERADLRVVSPYWLESYKWAGQEWAEVVVDHAAELTPLQRKGLMQALTRVRVKKEAA